MRKILLTVTGFLFVALSGWSQKSIDDSINMLLSRLTLKEKIAMIHANTKFSTAGVPRLGIPGLRMSDGPCGVREEINPDNWGSAGWKNDDGIYLPALTAVASTWNLDLARATGNALGQESRIRGKNIQLAPGINIQRSPLNGRNWEYMSEDPYLVSQLVVPFIQGLQSNGVAACVKHFILNNQETDRMNVNVVVSDRALHEIYLPGFKAAVTKGGALTVMGAYNKFRGQHVAYNKYLVQDILKKEWGFKGAVISDWAAVHNTVEAGKYGLDIEMGTNEPFNEYYMADPMLEAVKKGLVSEKDINDKVRRILYVIFRLHLMHEAPFDTTGMGVKLAVPSRCMVTRKIAEEAIVLLKNENHFLPLDATRIKSIAVIGDNATRKHSFGGGSTTIKARYEITPLEALRRRFGNSVKIMYAPGYSAPVLNNFIPDTTMDKVDMKKIQDAVDIAKKADVVLYFGGLNHNQGMDSEGYDRPNMNLPYGQDILLNELVKANPRIVVDLLSGNPVAMGAWLDKVPALLQNSYLGMEGGTAQVETIFGDVDPSGKLTYTFPKKLTDSPAITWGDFPGKDSTVHYSEGIFVGYRYFDTRHVKPLFPFGYGLSYTTFKYGNLKVPEKIANHPGDCTISFTVTNTGQYDGKEIAEVYVHQVKCSVPRPYKELKGFDKIALKKGETRTIKINLSKKAFEYYSPEKKQWVADPGKFEILVGSSSQDIRLKGEVTLL